MLILRWMDMNRPATFPTSDGFFHFVVMALRHPSTRTLFVLSYVDMGGMQASE